MVYTQAEYIKKSERERIMLNLLFKQIYNKNGIVDNIYHTPVDGKDEYDSVVCRFKNDRIYKNHIWEAKIRNENYPTILFEKNKYKSLKKITKRFDGAPCEIFYVSTHPEATYVFNITQIEEKYGLPWITEKHNVSTVELWRGQHDKDIIYLPIEWGKKIDINVNDINRIEKEMIEKKNPKKKIIGLFD